MNDNNESDCIVLSCGMPYSPKYIDKQQKSSDYATTALCLMEVSRIELESTRIDDTLLQV